MFRKKAQDALSFALVLLTSMFVSNTAISADNSIYVRQSGNNTTVTITQDGAGNVVRGIQGSGSDNTTPASIVGNVNTVTINQVGTGNVLDFGVTTSVANGGTFGGVYNYSVEGNNASAKIDSNDNGEGTSSSNLVSVVQTGNTAATNVNVLGSSNSITATTSGGSGNSFTATVNGNNNTQTVSISGGGNNTVTVNQGKGGTALGKVEGVTELATTNYNGSVSITVVGASNTASVVQTGIQNTTVLNITGGSNLATVTQAATAGNTTVNLTSNGSNNTFTITSTNH